jgi:hypothetical protein
MQRDQTFGRQDGCIRGFGIDPVQSLRRSNWTAGTAARAVASFTRHQECQLMVMRLKFVHKT